MSKFTPKMPLPPQRNNKEKNGPFPANINRLPSSIPAKSPKKVNEISKFFKNNKTVNLPTNKSKSYTQASKQNMSTADVIKIKETFPSVGVKEIDQINNIIKGPSKPKLRIQMTTKGPLRKQVIILMAKDNINKFIKNSSIHVINLNRNLKNAKSEVSVDYIHSDPLGITVVTNSVSLNSNLLKILTPLRLKLCDYHNQSYTSRSLASHIIYVEAITPNSASHQTMSKTS